MNDSNFNEDDIVISEQNKQTVSVCSKEGHIETFSIDHDDILMQKRMTRGAAIVVERRRLEKQN